MRRLCERFGNDAGMSLVELLVVMLILGILAGIAVPNFINQRAKADDANAKAIARAASVAVEAYGQDNLGAYDNVTGTILNSYDSTIPSSTSVTGFAGCPPAAYTICWILTTPASLTKSGTTFTLYKLKDGSIHADCSAHGTGGCPSDGDWDD